LALWSSFWGWQYFEATRSADGFQRAIAVWAQERKEDQTRVPAPSNADKAFLEKQITETAELRDQQSEKAESAVGALWKGAVALIAIWAAMVWTYLGFKKRT
jgi:hypothetical protein